MAETTKTPTPNLEESPVFKERAAQAMGGAPTSPAQFQAVGKSAPAIPGNTAAEPQHARRHPQTIFDVSPEAEAKRRKIDQARSELGQLVAVIDSKGGAVHSILEELADQTGKDEAKKQDFDLKAASAFVGKLLAAVDALKPQS